MVDEVGYLAYGDVAANLLFHVVKERHLESRPMNEPLDRWGQVRSSPGKCLRSPQERCRESGGWLPRLG